MWRCLKKKKEQKKESEAYSLNVAGLANSQRPFGLSECQKQGGGGLFILRGTYIPNPLALQGVKTVNFEFSVFSTPHAMRSLY